MLVHYVITVVSEIHFWKAIAGNSLDNTNTVKLLYILFYIQRITMCPHGYHHNGFMATPALGTQEIRLHIV